jgi:hypothetical protein
MKRVMIIAVLGVVCAVLAAPAVPMPYDPSNPPPTPYANIGNGSSTGDDTPWADPNQVVLPDLDPWDLMLQQNVFIRIIWDRVAGAETQQEIKTTKNIRTIPETTKGAQR